MSYEIVDLLMRLNEAGTTVIMVTHEHSLVRCFDKRVIILDRGTVVSDGGAIIREAATAHINPMSEISNEYVIPPEEDYSAYTGISSEEEPVAEEVVDIVDEELIIADEEIIDIIQEETAENAVKEEKIIAGGDE